MQYLWGVTYDLPDKKEELDRIHKHLRDFYNYQLDNDDVKVDFPDSYWMDEKGWTYIKWNLKNSIKQTVIRYKVDSEGKVENEVIPTRCPDRLMIRDEYNSPAILITGDTHRNFNRIEQFCRRFDTRLEDIMIILGDAGINYYGETFWGEMKDKKVKERLATYPITLFCIQGNHEFRPNKLESYKIKKWHGGRVYYEEEYPNILFAIDGEIYDFGGKKTLVVGGAYSVDKFYRLENGLHWFEDEQPNDEIKAYVEEQLDNCDWKVDVVLSHTTPYTYMPRDLFLKSIDQSQVDNSTEYWLQNIMERLEFKKWYAGHFHCDRVVDKLELMYGKVSLFDDDKDLKFNII